MGRHFTSTGELDMEGIHSEDVSQTVTRLANEKLETCPHLFTDIKDDGRRFAAAKSRVLKADPVLADQYNKFNER